LACDFVLAVWVAWWAGFFLWVDEVAAAAAAGRTRPRESRRLLRLRVTGGSGSGVRGLRRTVQASDERIALYA
jgi:hypothetical protein